MRYYRLQNGRLTSDRARVVRELERIARRAPCGYADAKIYEANPPSAVHVADDMIPWGLPGSIPADDERILPHFDPPSPSLEFFALRDAAVHALAAHLRRAFAEIVPREVDHDPVALLRVWENRTDEDGDRLVEQVPLDDEGPEDDDDSEVAP